MYNGGEGGNYNGQVPGNNNMGPGFMPGSNMPPHLSEYSEYLKIFKSRMHEECTLIHSGPVLFGFGLACETTHEVFQNLFFMTKREDIFSMFRSVFQAVTSTLCLNTEKEWALRKLSLLRNDWYLLIPSYPINHGTNQVSNLHAYYALHEKHRDPDSTSVQGYCGDKAVRQ